MCPWFPDDIHNISYARKVTIINHKLNRLSIDIAALLETRLPSDGSLKEQDYTFFWQGKDPDELWLHGVSFAVMNSLLSTMEPPTSDSEQILSPHFSSSSRPLNIVSIYAPTLCSSAEVKDQFYDDLHSALRGVSTTEELFLLGDFSACMGANYDSWPICIRHFGVRYMSENGQSLLELCSYHNLCITNTFFSPIHTTRYHLYQLNLAIMRRTSLNYILTTESYHSTNYNTDHYLIASKVWLQPKWVHCYKQ